LKNNLLTQTVSMIIISVHDILHPYDQTGGPFTYE